MLSQCDRARIFPGTLQAIFAEVQMLLLEFWCQQQKQSSPVPANTLFLLSFLHRVRHEEQTHGPGSVPRHQVVEAGSVRPALVILQSLQLLIKITAFFIIPLFFPLDEFSLQTGTRAVQPGRVRWMLSWGRLIKRRKEKKKGRCLHSHLPPTRTVPVSRCVGGWGQT